MGITVYDKEAIPSARRLMNSLRDMGYDFCQAVADLIDNSIEAEATEIKIEIEFDGDHSRVRIIDNGNGMNEKELQEAMRYGSERVYEAINSLGKFGLGLKTASLSQCRKLSVASRKSNNEKINACCWDLDYVEKSNKWEIIKPDEKDLERILGSHSDITNGTIVLWQLLDRMLGLVHPYSEVARKRLMTLCRELENHLAAVFHRFLSGEVPKRKLRIYLNDNAIEPWDPFARKEPKTKVLPTIKINLAYEGSLGQVELNPYVLPHQDDFSSREAFDKAGGGSKWNQQQGFYIYRSDRLIQNGGWSRIRVADEHLKLARIAFKFSPQLDDALKINVAKMRVQIPPSMKDEILEKIKPVVALAEQTYRRKTKPIPVQNNPIVPVVPVNFSQPVTTTSADKFPAMIIKPLQNQERKWSLDEFQEMMYEVTSDIEKQIVSKIFDRIKKHLKDKK